ncbi:uncharacterized protein LOC125572205 [Nematostella vectensis]|uniref:uncharacterized protein LOC125572205 n=1 Tax=Nematostella vectensis TaxID=45351 RepID=UPI0020772643|nr:uncharacterized protein LOC125572205 [Nematostella vectensis]
MERYPLKCIKSPAVSITIETNKTPPPDMICVTSSKKLQSHLTRKTGRKVTYEVELTSVDEAEVTCHAEGFPGSRHTFTVVAATSEQTRNGSFRLTNAKYPPNDLMKTSLEKLVQESVDATCMTKVSLSYGPGSLIVYVTLTTPANVSDRFVPLKNALLQNAPRYNLTIEPSSVKLQQVNTQQAPKFDDVKPTHQRIKVTWSKPYSNAQCTMRARPLAGASRDWVASSGVSSPASLSCVLDDLEPDTLYEVEVTVSVRGDTSRDTVYIKTTPTAVEVNDQNSTIVGLAVLVAILFLVIICLIVYIVVLKRAGLTTRKKRPEADNPGYSGFQNVAMQENANQDQHTISEMGDYEVAPSEIRGPNPDPIPQYKPMNNTPARPPNRSNVTQYEAINNNRLRDQHVPANRQYDSVDSTRMSEQNHPARRARNGTGDQGEPGYENTRKRGLPSEVYQSLQATTQHRENTQYAPLHPGTRIAARPGVRDERGVGSDIRGSEYQELLRTKATDPCYQRVGNKVTSA